MRLRRALILGHFSTVGDVESLEVVKGWCNNAQLPYDVAPYSQSLQKRMSGAIAPGSADPSKYSHLLVVCGPCYRELLRKNGFEIERYEHCHKVGINLTMVAPLAEWNPFDLLLERDSDRNTRPDLTFAREIERGPVAGRCVVARQREYGDRQRHSLALSLIDDLIARHQLPSIEIATDWPRAGTLSIPNSAAALSGLISHVDVLLTNRLHGLVFALRNGVPALAIDAVAGGDKVTAQARVLGWPVCLLADQATPSTLDAALKWCLTAEARAAARAASEAASKVAGEIEKSVAPILTLTTKSEVAATRVATKLRWARLFGG